MHTKMKTWLWLHRTAIVSVMTVVGLVLASAARAELKIAVVDVERTIGQYYKTKTQQDEVQTDREGLAKEIQGMQQRGIEMVKEVEDIKKELRTLQEDTALTPEARKDKMGAPTEALTRKMNQVREFGQKLDEFRNIEARKLQDKFMKLNREIVLEVTKGIQGYAEKNGYDLIFNQSKENPAVSDVIYAKKFEDITDKVIASLNAGAPAGGAAAAPAPGAPKPQ
jgi:Skp family chaperone for outer membrane proteins